MRSRVVLLLFLASCATSTSSSDGPKPCAGTCDQLSSLHGAYRVVIDSGAAFFTHDQGVSRVDLATGTATAIAPGGVSGATGGGLGSQIAIDYGNVYWSVNLGGGSTEIVSAPKSGGPAKAITTSSHAIGAMAVQDNALYYTASPSVSGASSNSDGAVMRVDLTSTTATPLVDKLPYAGSFVIQGSDLYYVVSSAAGQTSGAIFHVPLTGGTPVQLATGLDAPFAIQLEPNKPGSLVVGVTKPDAQGQLKNGLVTVSIQSGAVTPMWNDAGSIAFDSAFYFVVDGDAHETVYASTASGVEAGYDTTRSASPFTGKKPYGLAVDANNVYVADFETGLWRVKK